MGQREISETSLAIIKLSLEDDLVRAANTLKILKRDIELPKRNRLTKMGNVELLESSDRLIEHMSLVQAALDELTPPQSEPLKEANFGN